MMKVFTNDEIPQGSTEWLSFREGKITGTKLGKLYHKSRKEGEIYDTEKPNLAYYELLAERLADGTGDDDGLSSSRERGSDLEELAIDEVEDVLGIKFERGGVWQLNDRHIESPDGWTKDLKNAVEIKCLSSGRHLQAIIEDKAPSEYYGEYLNYFITNDQLETLYIALYDPRFFIDKLQLKIFIVERKDVAYEIERLKDIVALTEAKIEADIAKLVGE